MKLVLRREQRPNMLGTIIFNLDVRADLSADEEDAIKKYGLGDTLLYEKYTLAVKGWGVVGWLYATLIRMAHFALNTTIKAKDLIEGKRVQCSTIAEMVVVETEIKEEAELFGKLLRAAITFNGEEAIPI
jgi:hypothetical protein